MRLACRRFPLPLLAVLLLPCLLAGCGTLSFYRQAVAGQWEVMAGSRPNARILADPASDPGLRSQLVKIEEMRAFARDHLSLPGDSSYGRYNDLGREHVVWVLHAAPEFSLEAKTWRYPLLGELNYRGYFDPADAEALAADLRSRGYDVSLGGVNAYSTLGFFHDPVLNTFVDYADVDLAELLFHELTHRRLFRRGETEFNESLANAVAEAGVRRWLAHHGRHRELAAYEARLVRRREFFERVERTRDSLEALYASELPPEEMRRAKAARFAVLRDDFLDLRRRWGGRGLEWWLERELNNADLVSLVTYHEHIPLFLDLLDQCAGDFDEFFRRARRLDLPEN